ncbi:MAG: pilus assembly protein PilM [Phycisphaerae bacterium]|nr:pilus assembly protein PilM [Phycisphaerae bacterium]
MLGFLKNRCEPIALDIGGDSIKLLQMQRVGGVLSIRAGARWRFPDIPAADVRQRRDLAVVAVREMLAHNGFRGHRVVSSLSMANLHIKNIRMPAMTDSQLTSALALEAQERFELPDIKPDQMGYLNAGEVRQGADIRNEIILMGVPNGVVEDHLALLDDMGLSPEHIEAEPVALFRGMTRFFRRQDDEQVVSVVVDVGVSATRVIVARGRRIVFLKSIDIGGRRFTEVVGAHLNLSYVEASELRMRVMKEQSRQPRANTNEPELSPEQRDSKDSLRWSMFDAIRGEVESLAKEIALCLRYCSVTFRGLRFVTVTFTGGEAYEPALRELIGQHLNLPCVIGQPLRGVDVSGLDLGNRRGHLAEWAVCTGLAMRGVTARHYHEDEYGDDRLSA